MQILNKISENEIIKKIENSKSINEFIFVWYIFNFLLFLPVLKLGGHFFYKICFFVNTLIISIISLLKNKKLFLKKDIILLGITLVIFVIDFFFRKNKYTIETYTEFFKKCYISCYFFNRTTSIKNIMKYFSLFFKIAIVIYFFDPIFNYYFSGTYMVYGFSIVLPAFLSIYIYHFIKKSDTDIIFLVLALLATLVYGNRTCLLSIIFMLILTSRILYIKLRKSKNINIKINHKVLKKSCILVLIFGISFGINYLLIIKPYVSESTIVAENSTENSLKDYTIQSYSLNKYKQVFEGEYQTVFSGRFEIYAEAMKVLKNTYSSNVMTVLFGNGTGYFRSFNDGVYTHSIIFDLTIEYGVIGIILAGILFGYCFIKWLRNSKKEKFLFGAFLLCLAFPKLLLSSYFQIETYFWIFIFFVISYIPKKLLRKKSKLLLQKGK